MIVSIDSRNLNKRLKRMASKLEKGGKLTVTDAARFLRDGIKLNMPKGPKAESANSIQVIRQVHTKGKHEAVVGEYPLAHPEKIWRGQHFDLPAWMMTSTKALKHPWHSGNINMISTRRRSNIYSLTRQKFKTDVRNVVADSVK